jgi:segregation and condensation protein B
LTEAHSLPDEPQPHNGTPDPSGSTSGDAEVDAALDDLFAPAAGPEGSDADPVGAGGPSQPTDEPGALAEPDAVETPGDPGAAAEPSLFGDWTEAAAAAPAGSAAHDEPGGPAQFPIPAEVADYSVEELAPALAAVCFALNRSVTLGEAAAILGRNQSDLAQAAEYLAGTLRSGGLMLQRHQHELQLVTRPEVAWAVQRALNPEKPGRLSRAALETLAIVAYRQPLTRAAAEAIRGVNCEAVLDSLERRGLIVEVGRQDTPGHPRLFGTTLRFLQVVGLERIGDLPPLPEGLTVPELPEGDWDIVGDTDTTDTAPDRTFEVRGEAVETSSAGDPDGGYGAAPEDSPPDDADELDDSWPGHPSAP